MSIQIKRIGHIGILVADFERSFKFYTEVLGCKVTRRYTRPDGSETGFLRFEQDHHNFVIGTAPKGANIDGGDQQIHLGGVVVELCAPGYPGALADLRGRCAFKAALYEAVDGSLQE